MIILPFNGKPPIRFLNDSIKGVSEKMGDNFMIRLVYSNTTTYVIGCKTISNNATQISISGPQTMMVQCNAPHFNDQSEVSLETSIID